MAPQPANADRPRVSFFWGGAREGVPPATGLNGAVRLRNARKKSNQEDDALQGDKLGWSNNGAGVG